MGRWNEGLGGGGGEGDPVYVMMLFAIKKNGGSG